MAPKLGILAGGGNLPRRLVDVCRANGREIFVLAFEGQTDPDTVADVPHTWNRLGQVGAAIAALRQAEAEEVVMIGPVGRPSLREIGLDLKGAKLAARIGAASLSDDNLLRAVVTILEREGFRILGVDDILKDLLAPDGPLGRVQRPTDAVADIARGLEVARSLGAVDVGQAVVVQQGIVLGVEAAEGTDRLLERCAELRREGPGGVLVKIRKPQQERRVDLPTIGPRTVAGAAAAGLRGIAVEAGGTLIVDRPRVVQEADDAGLFLLGVALSEHDPQVV